VYFLVGRGIIVLSNENKEYIVMKTFKITLQNRAIGKVVHAATRAEAVKVAKAIYGTSKVSVVCID